MHQLGNENGAYLEEGANEGKAVDRIAVIVSRFWALESITASRGIGRLYLLDVTQRNLRS